MAARHDDGDSRRRGDAVVRPVLDVRQQHDLTLNRREPRERREEPGTQVGALQCLDGRVAARRGDCFVERHESSPADRSEPVERASLDDREQPGGESIGVSAGGELLEGVHEGLLGDVVGIGGVAEDAEGARESGAAVASYQCRERVVLPGQSSLNQLLVAQFGGHVICMTPDGDERECRGRATGDGYAAETLGRHHAVR